MFNQNLFLNGSSMQGASHISNVTDVGDQSATDKSEGPMKSFGLQTYGKRKDRCISGLSKTIVDVIHKNEATRKYPSVTLDLTMTRPGVRRNHEDFDACPVFQSAT